MLTPFDALQELFGDDIPNCGYCDRPLFFEDIDECYYIEIGDETFYVCLDCYPAFEEGHQIAAREYAKEELRIIKPLPAFVRSEAWTITPDEYERGYRIANTENAYRTRCRHEYTNYDDLISGLDQYNLCDQIWYDVIRELVDEMIDEEIESKELIVDFEDELEIHGDPHAPSN
jgi:hypothetical protein